MTTPVEHLSVWRSRARIVAYIDLVFAIPTLLYTVEMLTLATISTALIIAYVEEKKEHPEIYDGDVVTYLSFMLIEGISIPFLVIAASTKLWAVIMLFKATKKEEADYELALGRAVNSIDFCSFFVLFKGTILYVQFDSSCSLLALELVFRLILLFVVFKFKWALEEAIETQYDESPPQSVNVKS